MAKINTTQIVERYNRPGVLQKVALRTFFIQDGQFQDPYAISGVTIFRRNQNQEPSTILGSDELISSALTSGAIVMHFANSAIETTDNAFNENKYTPATTASGIHKISEGEFVVVLDGSLNLSGAYGFHSSAVTIPNTASAVREYIDVWTVKHTQNSKLTVVINEFSLFADTFLALTQPLLFSVHSTLSPKRLQFGEKRKLKINNEIAVQNKSIDSSIKNIFKDTIITSAMVEIVKLNEGQNLPARVTVSSFSETSSLIDITPDNTIVFNWDTDRLKHLPEVSAGDFGAMTGPYTVQAKFTMLNETVKTDLMHVILE